MSWSKRLSEFCESHHMDGPGPLCVALVVTKHAQDKGLPLNPKDLLTGARGQVAGLGKAGVQAILKSYGITRILAKEGGRTSRGSVGRMESYVELLNELRESEGFDLKDVQEWWIHRVELHFRSKPFRLRINSQLSISESLRQLFVQVLKRQTESNGAMFVGAVMQHLVGALLETSAADVIHHGASVADDNIGRDGDFRIGSAVFHVTVTPSADLILKCQGNLERSLTPIIVSKGKGVDIGMSLAENAGCLERLECLDIIDLIAWEVLRMEWAGNGDRTQILTDFVSSYNRIIDQCESDPSLRIEA